MATRIRAWMCTYCDFEVSSAEKPKECADCGETDSFEMLPALVDKIAGIRGIDTEQEGSTQTHE